MLANAEGSLYHSRIAWTADDEDNPILDDHHTYRFSTLGMTDNKRVICAEYPRPSYTTVIE